MKKYLAFMGTAILLFSNQTYAGLSPEQILEKAPQLKKSLESVPEKISIESVKEIDHFYEVVLKIRAQKKILYLTKDFKYMILGSLIDQQNKNITQERLKEVSKIDISTLPLKEALIYKEGNGTKKLVVFVDPLCPHCKSLINYLKGQKDYTLYMFIFPLSERSEEIGKKIMCSPNPMEAYLNPDSVKETCKDAETKIFLHSELGRFLSVTATPFVILEDGTNFYGFNKDLLEKFLNKRQ